MRPGLILACALMLAASLPARSHADAKQQQREPGRRIAVAAFAAPEAARARMAVLEVLSEHDEVEVVALEDIQFAAKRLKVDETSPAGRLKLSEELGIEAWLDGTIEDDSARFTLKKPDGRTIASTNLTGHIHVTAGLAGPKVWAAMGPWLSPRERAKRAIEAQEELALKKAKAREQELVRLRQVMEKRALDRVAQLKAAQVLAREKRKAFEAAMEHQATLVTERLAAAEKQRKDEERRQAQAEEAEFMASLNESGPPPAEEPAAAPRTASAWGGSAAASASVWNTPASATASAAPASSHVSSRQQAAAPAESAAVSSGGLSPATQRWLMAQGGAPAAAPPRYAPPAPAPAVPSNQEGLSPATRRWLEQQQLH
ncbi:MAG TPA: hypothetical protein VJV78_08915 [Polyangiales bacterium]|nr:hypothetical protein [Polyangiales bacterium]